jgi:hypothetical protein
MEPGGGTRNVDLLEIDRPTSLADIANLRLTLSEAKQPLARVQQGELRAGTRSCGSSARLRVLRRKISYHIKDWRLHQIATLFDGVTVRLP